MIVNRFVFALFAAFLQVPLLSSAQQFPPAISPPAIAPPSNRIMLDVVVDNKAGQPVTALQQQDFTILDNKSPRPITSFRIMTPAQEPVEVILLIDAVNTPYPMLAYMRNTTEQFLKSKEGTLAHPTAIAILTDDGVKIENGFSTNGNALSDALASNKIDLRQINRTAQWGGIDRLTISLNALHQLVTYASTLPGRKIVLFVTPGWPLLTGPYTYLDFKQEQQIFDNVVYLSSHLRQAGITLYNINPIGVDQPLLQANYYRTFLKGIAKPNDAQFADLSIQVLSVQSGGLALESNSDVAGEIQQCLVDAQSWYEISFDPPPSDKPNQYHHIEVKLDHPDLIARTRDGYYSNPVAVNP